MPPALTLPQRGAEAASFGVVTVLVGSLVAALLSHLVPSLRVPLPAACSDFNKHHVMELTLWLTGVVLHALRYRAPNR